MEYTPTDLEPLVTFLHTGKLGKLELGMTPQGVLEYCGLPYNVQSLAELHEKQPEVQNPELSRNNGGTVLFYGSVLLLFKWNSLYCIIVTPSFYPEHPLPMPLRHNEQWIRFINTQLTTNDALRAFFEKFELFHIRFARHIRPPMWISKDPHIDIFLDYTAKNPSHIKNISSGNMFGG